MLDRCLYAIKTEVDERRTVTREMFYSYQEAYDNRMKYANWYCKNGDVWIDKIDKDGASVLLSKHINEAGEIVDEYRYGNKEYKGKHVKD